MADVEPGRLEPEEHRRLGHVDADGHPADALVVQDRHQLLHRPPLQADRRGDGALQTRVAADRVLLVVQVGQLEAIGLGRAPEAQIRGRPVLVIRA
ncbi:MAG: hypothetical protein ACRD0A_14815 [Acidimicrobiales bacterium]